jgi:hypothetical protein
MSFEPGVAFGASAGIAPAGAPMSLARSERPAPSPGGLQGRNPTSLRVSEGRNRWLARRLSAKSMMPGLSRRDACVEVAKAPTQVLFVCLPTHTMRNISMSCFLHRAD